MPIELKVPSAGESITEVTIVEWVKNEGDHAEADETIALIETDKANVELPAPQAGVITKIIKGADENAEVGEVIGYMEAASAPAASASTAPSPAVGIAAPSPAAGTAAPSPAAGTAAPPPATAPKAVSPPAPSNAGGNASAALASPSVRRAMREQHIDPGTVQPSGPGGRITHGDLRPPQQVPVSGGSRDEERVPMTRLRRRIAERLVVAQQSAALLTTFNEVDMGPVMSLRKAFKDEFLERHGVKLGFMSFFVKAAVEALKAFPALNASIDGDDIVYHDYYDVGVAVGGGRGLVVPILRNAERMSFAQVEKAIGDFGKRARENTLKPEELQGGTFTISNGGVYGSMMSTPIVNPPQSGILGMHNIVERAVVKDGQIVAAPMMYLALTYDHRIVDGREAVSCLVRIKQLVENPNRLLLEV